MADAIYRPLQSHGKSTRLIKLHPGEPETPVSVNLLIVDLASKPKYEAISYAWGDDQKQSSMILNGQPHPIRYNLYSCLKQLRSTEKPRLLWADYLSISQNDNAEKGRQVGMMSDIFGSAVQVLVWTGEHADNSQKLFVRESDDERRGRQAAKDLDQRHRDVWEAFLDRPYWTRLWVVQEIALAESILVCCGESSIKWDDLVRIRALEGYRDRRWPNERGSPLRPHGGLSDLWYKYNQQRSVRARFDTHGEIFKLDNLRHRIFKRQSRGFELPTVFFAKGADEDDLVQLLDDFYIRSCTNPRDWIYALLALQNSDILRQKLTPDYDISIPELFLKACITLLQQPRASGIYIGEARNGGKYPVQPLQYAMLGSKRALAEALQTVFSKLDCPAIPSKEKKYLRKILDRIQLWDRNGVTDDPERTIRQFYDSMRKDQRFEKESYRRWAHYELQNAANSDTHTIYSGGQRV